MKNKFHTIYQITNTINDKIYIGKHQTNDLNDSYMGLGKYLTRAQNKHGIRNFKKKILYIFETEWDMNQKEIELVNKEFVERNDTYNLCIGGYGSFSHINNNKKFYVEKSTKTVNSWSKEKQDTINSKKGRCGKLNGMYGRDRSGKNNPRFGVTLSIETKRKISESKTGIKLSEEHKKKLSEGQKRRYAKII